MLTTSLLLNELLKKWRERLKRFEENPNVAKGLDCNVASGVHQGRSLTLRNCIKELEELESNDRCNQDN